MKGRSGSMSAALPIREIDLSHEADVAQLLVRDGKTPFVLRQAAKTWPALSKWSDRYLSEVAGHLQVAVHPARDYRGGKSQREVEETSNICLAELLRQLASGPVGKCSYARETRVLDQVAQLRADIGRPPLLTESEPHTRPRTGSSEASAWIGPAQTMAQLHWDPEHNLFVQIRGSKHFTLVPPSATRNSYPVEFSIDELAVRQFFRDRSKLTSKLQSAKNVSRSKGFDDQTEILRRALAETLSIQDYSSLCDFLLDVNNFHVDAKMPKLGLHPLFAKVQRTQSTLAPGDMIFIPRFWLHAVRSLDSSISINWFFLQSAHGSGVEETWIHELLLSHFVA